MREGGEKRESEGVSARASAKGERPESVQQKRSCCVAGSSVGCERQEKGETKKREREMLDREEQTNAAPRLLVSPRVAAQADVWSLQAWQLAGAPAAQRAEEKKTPGETHAQPARPGPAWPWPSPSCPSCPWPCRTPAATLPSRAVERAPTEWAGGIAGERENGRERNTRERKLAVPARRQGRQWCPFFCPLSCVSLSLRIRQVGRKARPAEAQLALPRKRAAPRKKAGNVLRSSQSFIRPLHL